MAKKRTHTPSPYIKLPGINKHKRAIFIKNKELGVFVGKVYGHQGQPVEENAKLFMTAPVLLEVCKKQKTLIISLCKMLKHYGKPEEGPSMYDEMRGELNEVATLLKRARKIYIFGQKVLLLKLLIRRINYGYSYNLL